MKDPTLIKYTFIFRIYAGYRVGINIYIPNLTFYDTLKMFLVGGNIIKMFCFLDWSSV